MLYTRNDSQQRQEHFIIQFGMNIYEKIAEEAGAPPAIVVLTLLKDTTIRVYIHSIYSLYP